MNPCDNKGIILSHDNIKDIVTKSTYPYQPGKTLVETIEVYQNVWWMVVMEISTIFTKIT